MRMDWKDHARTTGGALKQWFIAQCYDSLAVAALWLLGLLIIGVPWAPAWALLAGALQFLPHIGPVLGLIPPATVAAFMGPDWWPLLYVLILYAVVAAVDGLFLQPYIMKRTVRVPIWASILAPLVLGALFNLPGVIASAPLLAIVYAYKAKKREAMLAQSSTPLPSAEPEFPAPPTQSPPPPRA
jgi:predicted PurR-regulated permease PerM